MPGDSEANPQPPPFDMAEIHRIAAQAAAEAAASAVAAALAAQAALTQAAQPAPDASSTSFRKKPDLPKFDPKNVDIWIRRVESAYTRASISSATEKFAFLETLFDVGYNPKIDEFLYGTATDARWEDFLKYLKKEYGRTKQQQAASVLDGISREGRRPTQLLAFIDEQLGDITIEDIKKEMLLRQLPHEVRHALAETSKTATAATLAEKADDYFSRDGKHLNATATATVNNVETHDNSTDINAAFNRGRNRSSVRPPPSSSPSGNTQSSGSRSKSRPRLYNGECYYHSKFKQQARICKEGCRHYSKFQSGNAQAGQRT